MSNEKTIDDDILDELDGKWSDPTGSYYYCLVLPNGDVEYHGSKNALRSKLGKVYGDG